ncbi:MAG: hypothetical protein JW857_09080 [Bacteroidales bacterium]|nr:hypothetical protein [Bacteroidales bacterium]
MKTKKLKINFNVPINLTILAVLLTLGFTSCNQKPQDQQAQALNQTQSEATITEQEVLDAQKAWGEGIVKIGKVYLEDGDYTTAALNHINDFYYYDQGYVLFKPTMASEKQFRTDLEGALSYFVAGNENYSEDHGFAIKPWSSVRWENIGTKIIGNIAVAMGNYYFTPQQGGEEVKVEYSFAYTKNEEGKLKIILHDSHLPYSPAEKH